MIGASLAETRDLRLTLRERIYAARPPTLTDGQLRVLREMAGDFSAREWAHRFDATLLEVERACFWLEVEPQK